MTYEQNLAAPELLSTAEYIELATRNAAFEAWRAGRASYHPSEVPADVPQITNDERSALERFEFCADVPKSYTLYIRLPEGATIERARAMGACGLATTWTGERLGRVTFGRPFRDSFGGRRVPVWIDSINGRAYHGTYYQSAGDYARVKLSKPDARLVRAERKFQAIASQGLMYHG